MTSVPHVVVCATLLTACGGSTTRASAGDAAGTDSGEDASMCPPPGSPDADVYMCEAGPTGFAGCTGEELGDKNVIYPEGCQVLLTRCSTFGQVSCTCQQMNLLSPHDGGLAFICPI